MPEITLLGWMHTGVGAVALLSGFYTLARFKVIRLRQPSGKTYLICTLITAFSALAIFKHGGFGVAHALAVLTLIAVLIGVVAETTPILGRLSRYIQAASYTATLLFHMIPAVTDGLMRLPLDSPTVTSLADPMLRGFYLALLATYIIGLGAQLRWLRKPENRGNGQ